MPASDPIHILLAHNHWATRLLIEACAPLTSEQFHQRFEIGHGSLHDTLAHILSGMRGWGDLLAGRAPRQHPDQNDRQYTPAELLTLLDELAADLHSSAHNHPLDGIVSSTRDGKTRSYSRAAVLTHVTTHGMHHRAQALNMLRRLGVSELPPSTIRQWTLFADSTHNSP